MIDTNELHSLTIEELRTGVVLQRKEIDRLRAQLAEGATILERAWYHKMDDGDYEIFDAKDATCGKCIEVVIVPVTALTAAGGRDELSFVDALSLCERGLTDWKSKPHNKKWWKRIDGTPIPNDLLCCIAEAIAATQPAQESVK